MSSFITKTSAGRVRTRMGPALCNIIEDYPALGGTALLVKFADTENPDPSMFAYTDGRTVHSTKHFETLDKAAFEPEFVTLHELMHVALAHPQRARVMHERTPQTYDAMRWNIATDAIINSILRGATPRYRMPKGMIDLAEIVREIQPDQYGYQSAEQLVHQWSSERLYEALREHERNTGTSLCDLLSKLTKGDGGGSHRLCGEIHESPAELAEANKEIEQWSRQARTSFGLMPGFQSRLAKELPKSTTPWETLLQRYLLRYGRPKRSLDFSRPHRRWLALEHDHRVHENIDLPYIPSTGPSPAGRIAVALDTSGSCWVDPDLIARFLAETHQAMAQVDLHLRLIVCDAQVREVYDLRGSVGRQRLRSMRYSGGRGTDFAPAIAKAVEFKADAMVYFTDLIGNFGPQPQMPVLWAVPELYANSTPEFGRLVVLR